MPMANILEINKVSKLFNIHGVQKPYLSLREQISYSLKPGKKKREEFWALKDITLNIEAGDTVALIGKNGAGKSTLLKILSRITPPTSGSIKVRGRIASLLEVGTGFHPELTGRENIFLNGSILGMKKREIRKSFDEIVEFSGVEKFLDTALKHYSSGMQLRLAFSVAAFLEPEIMVIDEVLAVGDFEFQKKCLGKMEDVSRSGRTIIFVSHNMAAVKKLCKRGVLLQQGQVSFNGDIYKAVDLYTSSNEDIKSIFEVPVKVAADTPGFAYKLQIEDLNGTPFNNFPVATPWQIRVNVKLIQRVNGFIIGIGMLTQDDIGLRTTWSESADLEAGEYEFIFREQSLFLSAGVYKLIVGLSARMVTFQYVENCATLRICDEIAESASSIKVVKGVGIVLNPMQVEMIIKN